MPVRIYPTSVKAEPVQGKKFAEDATEVLKAAYPNSQFHDLLQSSFDEPVNIAPNPNGLVYSIIEAYGRHHHLKLRPEDIWFAILTQMNLYINKDAEKLRNRLVAHKGKRNLRLEYDPFDRHRFDFGVFSRDMSYLLEQNVVDPELREWMMPSFSTTTDQDTIVASIIMMCSLQKYFTYTCGIICGFPSVTLLGEREDYVKILSKLDKLATFGAEPRQFAALLKPVLARFIRTFDDPQAPDVITFWQRAMHRDNSLCGFTFYSGWITAFCFWNQDGTCLYNFTEEENNQTYSEWFEPSEETSSSEHNNPNRDPQPRTLKPIRLSLDGTKYHQVEQESIPPGFGRAPVKIEDMHGSWEAEMVAGSLGISCSYSPPTNNITRGREGGDEDASLLNTMQPATGWGICEMQQKQKQKQKPKQKPKQKQKNSLLEKLTRNKRKRETSE